MLCGNPTLMSKCMVKISCEGAKEIYNNYWVFKAQFQTNKNNIVFNKHFYALKRKKGYIFAPPRETFLPN